MARAARRLLACAVLEREVRTVLADADLDLEPRFLDPALHEATDRLPAAVAEALDHPGAVVCCGLCHPALERTVKAGGGVRTCALNCLELLLGRERYRAEAAAGTYFLPEAWARDWLTYARRVFGPGDRALRALMRSECTSLLALRTPCSGEFEAEARAVAEFTGLPLRWADADLVPLREALEQAAGRAAAAAGDPR